MNQVHDHRNKPLFVHFYASLKNRIGQYTTMMCKKYFTPLVKYYIYRVSLSQDYIQKCYYAVFEISVNRYGIGLSNELLFVIIA